MPLVKLDTGFNIEIDFAIAPFHRRFFALLLDLVVQFTYVWLAGKFVSWLFPGWDSELWHVMIFLLPFMFYHLICEVSMNGQSVGKKALGIKVMTAIGGEPSFSQYVIRWMFRIIDFPILLIISAAFGYINAVSLLFIFAGLLCVILTARSQRIGDLVAGTILIDLKNRTSWEDTVFTEIESTYKPRYPQVMQLSDRDINTLKSIIESVKRKNDYELSMRIADRIRSKLKMESEQDSLEFLETLLKDYNYYTTTN